jgi:SAM-dependent methyltransferase
MGKIACAHPGKIGDALYALPSVRELCRRHGCLADFYTSSYCRPLTRLLEAQSYIDQVVVPDNYVLRDVSCGGQPWQMPVPGSYDAIYQMGFRSFPSEPLPDHIARSVGLPPGLPIMYDCDPGRPPIDEPYIVAAPRGPSAFFQGIADQSPIAVVELGAAGERSGSARAIDQTGLDMLDSLPWIAHSKGFVGLQSSMLVLANGFEVPKVAPHGNEMSHVVRSQYNYYPVNPTPAQALRLLGVTMKFCKTLSPADYEVVLEMQHAKNIKNVFDGYVSWHHEHRAWEYGIVLRALRDHRCVTVLDVGGGGSAFAPAATWVGMQVSVVDPEGHQDWVRRQNEKMGKQIAYEQADFMNYVGGEFDAVTCISVLEHVPDDAAFFKKLVSHVKPGGILALTVDFWPDGGVKTHAHLRTYNAARLMELARSVEGLEPVGGVDYGHIGPYVNGYTFASLILKKASPWSATEEYRLDNR